MQLKTRTFSSSKHTSPYSSNMYNMSDSNLDKEERKREYNRLAQREFRRRRKEHLKNLEQSQKEQSSEKLEEIERLRYQNIELKRENEALKAQIYGSPSSSQQHVMSAAPLPVTTHHQQHDSRSYSLSPSLTGSHSASSAGSPSAVMSSDMMQMPNMAYSSSMMVPAMSPFSDSSMGMMSSQPYSMVHPSGSRHHTSKSSLESSEFGKPPRHTVGSSFQSMNNNLGSAVEGQAGPIKMAPNDYSKARNHIMDIFQALISDPSLASSPEKHLATLKSMSNSLPTPFKPTKTQLEMPHYFGIDLIASPSLRDILIQAGDDVARSFLNEFGNLWGGDAEHTGQLTIWGDDFDNEMAWEFSGAILERWSWLLGRSWVIRGNFWRKHRGAPLLPEW